MGVRQLYERTLAERGYVADPAQLRAIAALERCEDEWADYKARRSNALTKLLRHPPIPRGVYMHGGVGRGKSFLMDCFFVSVPLQLTDPYGLALLACIITATPGTIWMSYRPVDNLLLIHVFDLVDEQAWVSTVTERYERPLREIFE